VFQLGEFENGDGLPERSCRAATTRTKLQPWSLPKARPISCHDAAAFQRHQMSVLSAAESPYPIGRSCFPQEIGTGSTSWWRIGNPKDTLFRITIKCYRGFRGESLQLICSSFTQIPFRIPHCSSCTSLCEWRRWCRSGAIRLWIGCSPSSSSISGKFRVQRLSDSK
jgi:hypothetical protein